MPERGKIRKAKIADAKKIYSLISFWAKRRRLLERSLDNIYENIRDFWVCQKGREILGVCALHIVGWQNLAEIRSLAVSENHLKKKIGIKLVKACIEEAKSLGVKKIFVLTFVEGYFRKIGFKKIAKSKLPHKIWKECINCVHFPNCKEKALILDLQKKKL